MGREKTRGSPCEAVIAEIRPLPAMAALRDLVRVAGHHDAGDASHVGDPIRPNGSAWTSEYGVRGIPGLQAS